MRSHLLLITLLGFILSGCPQSIDPTQKKIEENNLNLPNPVMISKLGISFELSELLEKSYYYNFALKSDAVFFTTSNNSIFFSVEKYTPSEIESIQYQNEIENQPDLDALRDFYANKRHSSLEKSIVSEPVELYSRTGKKGWMQSVEDIRNNNNYDLHYLTGTIPFKGDYYVFQFISGKNIMPYLLDDFLNIIKSVR